MPTPSEILADIAPQIRALAKAEADHATAAATRAATAKIDAARAAAQLEIRRFAS